MLSIINLSPIWEHTFTDILNHGNKTEMGIIMTSWVKHNNLDDMSDLLIYDLMSLHQVVLSAIIKKQLRLKRPNLCRIHL